MITRPRPARARHHPFAALTGLNFTTDRGGMRTSFSGAFGLRPMRALRFTTTSLPTPGNTKPFLACLAASVASSSRICVLCFFEISNFVAM